jgi:hypothetical protein
VCRVMKSFRYGGQDLKAEGAPQPDRRCIGFDHRVELHRLVAIRACLVKDVLAEGPADSFTASCRVDDKAGVSDVCSWARVKGMGVRAPEDTSIVIDGDNGAPGQLAHPARACARFGSRRIPRQGLARCPHFFRIGQIAGQSATVASYITMRASIA